ncbi:MAG: hypothetical protein U9O97_04515 [Elusimicrobiota bacterium]|nr:hypothetical protein [Elusimicrobiota bacterium]
MKKGCCVVFKKHQILKVCAFLTAVLFCGCAGEDAVTEGKNIKQQDKKTAFQGENLKFAGQINRINSQVNMAEIKANLTGLRTAISIFYDDNREVWPAALEELSPRYIAKIPEGDWDYNPATGEIISKSHPGW